MILYGGSSLEAGGFLEPDVFAFVRNTRYVAEEDPLHPSKSQKVRQMDINYSIFLTL